MISECNNYSGNLKNLEYSIQKIIINIGCLIVMIIKFKPLDIFIIASILF